MNEGTKDEAFLDRWSRLKQKERAEEAAAPPAEVKQEDPPAPLPAVDKLAPDSDFKPFMDPRVDPTTRRDALKKLFTNAHFNAHDPFEPYSIDLTGEDPIPEAMLKTLEHAKRLLFDEPEKVAQTPAEVPPDRPETSGTTPKADDVTGKQDA
jgi:hypothetical protein